MKYDPILKENALLRNSEVSQPWIKAGFRFGDKGTHTSRTIMLKELALLLEDQEPNAPRDAYVSAILTKIVLVSGPFQHENLPARD